MIALPSTIPSPSVSGYNVSVVSGLLRTSLNGNSAKPRQTSRGIADVARRATVQVKWLLTQEQLDVFVAWHRDTLCRGTRAFEMPLPQPTDTLMPVTRVQFAGRGYSLQNSSVFAWTVSATLFVPVIDTITEDALDFIISMDGLSPEDIIRLSERAYFLMNTTIPQRLNN